MNHFIFSNLTPTHLQQFLTECREEEIAYGGVILQRDTPRNGLYLLLSGKAEIYIPGGLTGHDEVLDIIEENELIGLSHIHETLFSHSDTKPTQLHLEVRAINEAKVLFIPDHLIQQQLQHAEVKEALLKEVSARLNDVYHSLAEQMKLANKLGEEKPYIVRVQDIMTAEVKTTAPTTTATEAAKLMSNSKSTALLIVEETKLTGILTERDFVNRLIATGTNATHTPVEKIMTVNPITIDHRAFYYEALSKMLMNGINHLPVTADENELVGIVTLANLLQYKKEGLLQTTERLNNLTVQDLPTIKEHLYAVLSTLMQQNVPIYHTLHVMNTLYDQLIEKCVRLAQEAMGEAPPCAYSFYTMGSSGRKEQFLLTDQDHFLLYEKNGHGTQQYFEAFSQKIVDFLQSAGYQKCKGHMMSNYEQWRGPLDQWESRLNHWVLHSTQEKLLLAQNFFSCRFITGDAELHQSFIAMVESTFHRKAKIFLYRLSENERSNMIPALEQPIRSLFRKQRKEINIKKHLLFPYHHSLQILSIMHGIVYGTPLEKLQKLHERGVISENFHKDLQDSAAAVLGFYVQKEWNAYKSGDELGQPLQLTNLTTREKEQWMLNVNLIKQLQTYMLSYY
ncbi:DUF294 nucleotidyltransferase-like domain-containing protein [Bacillus sp. FJAT-45066]|uniref:DUF294 nucleotidyltransferase-like domain-containing protein n=1 Tax=Bacillus sp. FJAT-45066 TaxID=2011010 RepID=UPI0011414103|nr:DUF294 nucleotidyltransferase-like domain-containing protein [Bacillus sp. FJAT-45066]